MSEKPEKENEQATSSGLDGPSCSAISLDSASEFLKGAAVAYFRAAKTADKTWYRQDVESRESAAMAVLHFAKRFGEVADAEISKQNDQDDSPASAG